MSLGDTKVFCFDICALVLLMSKVCVFGVCAQLHLFGTAEQLGMSSLSSPVCSPQPTLTPAPTPTIAPTPAHTSPKQIPNKVIHSIKLDGLLFGLLFSFSGH